MGTDTYINLRAFVDELVRCGMRAVVTSPGSRNTPLLLTLAREERLETFSQIDERCAAIPAIALTAFARPDDRRRALDAGYDMHVAKPVEPTDLLRACLAAVGRQASRADRVRAN